MSLVNPLPLLPAIAPPEKIVLQIEKPTGFSPPTGPVFHLTNLSVISKVISTIETQVLPLTYVYVFIRVLLAYAPMSRTA